MAPVKKTLMVAKDSFVCGDGKGNQWHVGGGETLPHDHPAVKAAPDMFEPAKVAAA
jgi:hypothetical protein